MEHCGVTIQRLEGDVSHFLNSSTCLRCLARSWEDVVDDDDGGGENGGYADGEDDSGLQTQPPSSRKCSTTQDTKKQARLL